MCIGGSTPTPAPTPVAPPAISTADVQTGTMSDVRRRRAAAAGSRSTILTGAGGAATPTGGGKTLLGA